MLKQKTGFPGGSAAKNLPAMLEMLVQSLGKEDLLGKEMAIHSSILVWEIPRIEEPIRLQTMGSQESDTTECADVHTHTHPHIHPKGWEMKQEWTVRHSQESSNSGNALGICCWIHLLFLCSEHHKCTPPSEQGWSTTSRCLLLGTHPSF